MNKLKIISIAVCCLVSISEALCMEEENDKYPYEFVCPITFELMINPVIAADGFSYEESTIREWIARNPKSPKTGLPLESLNLIPNHNLRILISEWKDHAKSKELYEKGIKFKNHFDTGIVSPYDSDWLKSFAFSIYYIAQADKLRYEDAKGKLEVMWKEGNIFGRYLTRVFPNLPKPDGTINENIPHMLKYIEEYYLPYMDEYNKKYQM